MDKKHEWTPSEKKMILISMVVLTVILIAGFLSLLFNPPENEDQLIDIEETVIFIFEEPIYAVLTVDNYHAWVMGFTPSNDITNVEVTTTQEDSVATYFGSNVLSVGHKAENTTIYPITFTIFYIFENKDYDIDFTHIFEVE